MSSGNGANPPAPSPSHNSSFSLLLVLGRERLTGPNYMDWIRNLGFTLRYKNKEYVLDEQIPKINDVSTQKEIEAHQKHYDDANKVSCIMASSMSPELQKTFKNTWAYQMNQQLKEIFQAKASKECLDVVKSLMACKPKPGASICAFVLEMKGYFDRLESLNMVFDAEVSINIILSVLPADYNQFVLSYLMNEKETSIMELHSFLKGKAAQGKSGRGSKRKVESEIARSKRSSVLLLQHKGALEARLKHRDLNLVMGTGNITHVTRIEKYELMLNSRVMIDLNNCCYSSEMTINIISFHALFKDGYKFLFENENGDTLVYSNGCFMFKASPCKGIYETVKCISNNGNVILNVVSSHDLDKSKLWHFRHGRVNKKRMAQLQKDGVLESFDLKSDDACESCLLGRMTKSPFTRTCEKAEGLLDLVHTDVCGPFRSAIKDGKRYYVTFMMISIDMDMFICLNISRIPLKYSKEESFGYLFYKPKDNMVCVAQRGVFIEKEMISKEDSGTKIDLEEIQESVDEEPIVNTATQQEVVTLVEPDDISLPICKTSSREAKASPEAAKWKEAMKSEIQSMYDNQVWNLVDTTPGLKTVGCKCIFKKKTNIDGKVHTYKARLVAKGYTQTYGIDYEETFSPVAKIKSIRIMLAIAAFYDYEIWQMDVKTIFLNKKLTEDVFMAQPEGFENANEDESCIYVNVSGSVVVFLVLYVDDILLIGNDILTLQSVKDWLGKCFAMKDLEDAAYIFGSIMYAMTCTSPDVSIALSMVSQHQQNPGKSSAVALDGTLYLVDHDRLRPIIVDDVSKWETIGFSVQVHN
uniref:Retrotransposon protein, putative, Ty1-copia subclass n=1 Tax=Tanacetum cinerariifolium TaxID=118510 RepID=A0A6L2MK64_TANCI|nr:hypothetical protein [Tanacetum cinerariifolium]